MKCIFFLIILSELVYGFPSLAQQSKSLEIYSITEYIDGYVIKAIDRLNTDTLNIISEKGGKYDKQDFTKLTVGKKYSFQFEDRMNQMSASPLNHFIIKIKRTVVWKNGDGVKNLPVFATNTKGLWIKKQAKTRDNR